MNTPLLDQDTGESPGAADLPSAPRRSINVGGRRRGWVLGGIAAATMLAVAGAAIIVNRGGDDAEIASPPPLELSLGESDAIASCMPFDVAILADMSPAFAATATGVVDGTVTLAVDRWYTGGDADTVVLGAPSGMEALIGGIDFEVGKQYLLTAAEGTVNFCGYSGPATPEYTAAFEQAFAG